MSFLSKVINPWSGKAAGPSSVGTASGVGAGSYLWGQSSWAGEVVSPSTAAQIAAVFCAIKIISETMGMISLDMYEKSGGSIRAIPKHPLQFRLHDEPNDDQTAMEWRMMQTASMALWGNAYSQKIMRGDRLAALRPLMPQTVQIRPLLDGSGRIYRYFPLDGYHVPRDFSANEILHPKTMSLSSPWEGTSPVAMVRNAFGLAQALEKYSSKFFANGAIPAGIINYPGVVDDELQRNMLASWEKLYGGGDSAHRIAILEEGVKYTPIGTDPDKTQLTEVKKFQVLEIARVWRIPPHMLYEMGDGGSAPGTVEQASIEFVRYTLMPWVRIWEQTINRSLLAPSEKGKVFCAFNVRDIEKGDMKSQYDAHAVAVNWGWESPNDVLRDLGKNPREDPEGDAYLQPGNMMAFGEGITPRQMGQMQGMKPPSMGAGPSSSTVPPGGTPPPVGAKLSREIFEIAQDIAQKSRDICKDIERQLTA